jgi:hypothetical protein
MEGLAERSICGFENNTIIIKSNKVNMLNTNFSKTTIIEIINSGYEYINEFLII